MNHTLHNISNTFLAGNAVLVGLQVIVIIVSLIVGM